MTLLHFDINPQRKAFLDAKGKVVLNACPGSGKTTAIAQKLLQLEEENRLLKIRYSGIACLSFTNTAKDEIERKYAEISGKPLGFPNHISTIDSFINHFITLPFYNLLNRDFKRPKILDNTGILDSMWTTRYKDNQGKERDGLLRPLNNFKANNNRSIYHTYLPSTIRIEPNGAFTINGKAPSSDVVSLEVFINYCKYIKSTQFNKGLISTGDSAYIALYLLKKDKRIGLWLANRFPHIIIDEAQDNSEMQHCIFDELEKCGLKNIEYVGDPFQSLYEWRDAKPSLFLEKYGDNANWQGLDLTDNRRSPQRIIDTFSLLRSAKDPKINSVCMEDRNFPITIYRYSDENSPRIIKHFDNLCIQNKLFDNQIVVRGNTLKNKMLGVVADQEPWKIELPYQIIEAKFLYEGKAVKESIKQLRKLAIYLQHPGTDYTELKELEETAKSDYHFNALLLSILHDLPAFTLSISDWTTQTQQFLKERLKLQVNLDFVIKTRGSVNFKKAILADPLNQHFRKSFSEKDVSISTVHQVKGKSLDGILIFFNPNKHKDTITFDDISSSEEKFLSEKQRIIYVAMSRPKHLLAMAFPSTITAEKLREKFGMEIEIIPENALPQ